MFWNKKMLCEDKQYFLLFLSILSDIAFNTWILAFMFALFYAEVDPSVGAGIGFYWILGVAINVYTGIIVKILDIISIRYYKKHDKKKLIPLVILQFLGSLPSILYWSFYILMFMSSLLGI